MSGERPVDVVPTLAEQLRVLGSSPGAWAEADADADPDGELTARWGRLSREVVAVVPSCVAVSIALSRLGVDVLITAPITGPVAAPEPTPRVVLISSSLALSLPAAGSGSVLVLQASAPGAFLLLAEHLTALLGSGHPSPELDAHLAPLGASTGPVLAEALAELSLLDRALGVLIGHGWPPEEGEQELHRRAAAAGLTVAAVAERLLASPSPAAPQGTD
jgi:hypothetical protein